MRFTILFVIFSLFCSSFAQEGITLKEKLQKAMHSKDYVLAAKLAKEGIDNEKDSQYFSYMHALALFQQKSWEEAKKILLDLSKNDKSDWFHKVQFLLARVYVKLRDYDSAEQIYAKQAERLRSSERRQEVAQVYTKFAEELGREAKEGELTFQPDYNKAYYLYQKAFELSPGEDLCEELRFQMANMRLQAKDYYRTVSECERYLQDYDGIWRKAKQLPGENTKVSKHAEAVRYYLGECLLNQSYHAKAREVFQDLLSFLEKHSTSKQKESFRHDALWQITRTYSIPQTSYSEVLAAIESLQKYLSVFPEAVYSVQAAYEVGAVYIQKRRTNDAILSLQKFLDGQGYSVAKNLVLKKSQKDPLEVYEDLRKKATYTLGKLFFDQKQYDKAEDIWQKYISQFPNGEDWSNAQRGIVDIHYQSAEDLVAQKQYEEARKTWEKFLQKHPLDSRASKILFTFGEIYHQQALQQHKNNNAEEAKKQFEKAIQAWERLASKYPNSNEAFSGLFKSAHIYEFYLHDLIKALEFYQKVSQGDHRYEAQNRVAAMTKKELKISTERIYHTNETAKLKVQTRNIEKLKVQVYRLDMQAYFRKEHKITEVENLDLALIEADKSWEHQIASYAQYLPLEQYIEIPMEGAGVYVVQVIDRETIATTLLVRSDLNFIVKTSRKQILVFVEDMVQSKPATDVDVWVSDGEKIILEGKTGKDGVFSSKSPALKDANRLSVFAQRQGHIASNLLSLSGLGFSQGLSAKGYVFTDRPVYQPGEQVNIRAILRDVVDGSYAIAKDKKCSLRIANNYGKTLWQRQMTLSDFGTLHETFMLPEKTVNGAYRIYIEDSQSRSFSSSFNVRHLRLSKIKLSLELNKNIVARGEVVEGTFQASYYYGHPVVGKQLSYTLPDGRSFTQETDEKGQVSFSFDTSNSKDFINFNGRLVTEGLDVTGQVLVTQQGLNLTLSASRGLILAGENVELKVSAKDSWQKPVTTAVKISAYRRVSLPPDPVLSSLPWTRSRYIATYSEVLVKESEVKTSESGDARATFTLAEGGEYTFRAVAVDQFSNKISASMGVVVSGDEDSTRLRIFTDKNHLKVGEEQSCNIHSRVTPSLALVTFEGEEILDYHIVPLKEGNNSFKFLAKNTYFPNCDMAVAMMATQKFYQAQQSFTVEREMKVSLAFDKKHYAPGEKAVVRVSAKDHGGKPVSAEISLALIDEALFAVAVDDRENIIDFFQKGAKRAAAMRTMTTCDFSYSGKVSEIAKSVLEEQKRIAINESALRSRAPMKSKKKADRFGGLGDDLGGDLDDDSGEAYDEMDMDFGAEKESSIMPEPEPASSDKTANYFWWKADVVTDQNGEATIEVVMPDKESQWRLTAVGCDQESLVGENKSHTQTRRQFFVELRSPRFAVENDVVKAFAKVHNLSDYEGKADARLEITSGEKSSVISQTIEIKKGVTEFIFDEWTVPAVSCTLKLEVSADSGKLQGSDVKKADVRPFGIEYTAYKKGQANANHDVTLGLENNEYRSVWMEIDIVSSPEQVVLDLISTQGLETFGNLSVISELQACVAGVSYLKTSENIAEQERLMRRARSLVADLVSSQSNNGWGAFSKSSPNVVLTSRALWALANAKKAGVFVDDEVLTSSSNFLQNSFSSLDHNDNETKALVQYVLTFFDKSDFSYGNRLYRQRHNNSVAGLCYTALLLEALDKDDMAKEIVELIKTKVVPFEKTEKKSWRNSDWTNSKAETVALSLLTLQAIVPEDTAIASGIAYLMSLGFTAHAHGNVVAAVTEYYGKTQHSQNNYELQISVNGKLLQSVKVQGKDAKQHLQVPQNLVKSSGNKVKFDFSGVGTYHYAITLRGFSKNISEVHPWEYPCVQSRQFLHAPLEYKGRTIGVRSSSPVSNMELGQVTNVQLSFHRDEKLSTANSGYLVVEEHLPAGTIVMDGSVTGSFTHFQEDRGRLLFYFSPERNVSTISYQLAAFVPGSYNVLPTIIYDLQNPGAMELGKVAQIKVLSPGEKSSDPYEMNQDELYTLGKLYFDDAEYKEAKRYLSAFVKRDKQSNQREVAKMLLWIYTTPDFYNASKIVESFEVLREKYPQLNIPFDKILVVGKAYRDMKEFERAYLVYYAIVEGSFSEEANVAGILQEQREFLGSVDYLQSLWQQYHDSTTVVQSHFGIAQTVYGKLDSLGELENNIRLNGQREVKAPTRQQIIDKTLSLLEDFVSRYSDEPLADSASFSMASAFLDLDKYDRVIEVSKLGQKLFNKSRYFTSFQYMEALAHFSMDNYDKAVEKAKIVAEGDSEDKDYSTYILGQIYHAQGNVKNAIDYYGRISEKFADAKDSIEYFQRNFIRLPEVTQVQPKQKAELEIEYCNIKEAHLLIYRVDLMTLYLQRKNLSEITQVHLSGISPTTSMQIALGKGEDYQDMKKKVTLDLSKEGAYLVICRGDNLFTSGLVLVSSLKLEVQTDASSGRVRVYVKNAVTQARSKGVHVKVIGSRNNNFISGETDLRGIFVAEGVQGKVTVIARDKTNLYAFYRSPLDSEELQTYKAPSGGDSKFNFRDNLNRFNDQMRKSYSNKLKSQLNRGYEGMNMEEFDFSEGNDDAIQEEEQQQEMNEDLFEENDFDEEDDFGDDNDF